MGFLVRNIEYKFKNPKGNISILVIFVLLASSLIGILTMNFVKQMMSYTQDIYSYNKSYYYAKAGLELALVEIDNADIGFSNSIGSGIIFQDNFDCDNCGFDVDIVGKTQYLSDKFWISTGCHDSNAFHLSGGESIVLSLFTQSNITNNLSIFDDSVDYDKDILKYLDYVQFINNENYQSKFNIGLIVLLDGEIQRNLLFMKTLDGSKTMFKQYFDFYTEYYGDDVFKNDDYLMYLVLSNIEDDSTSFCISIDDINVGGKDIKVEIATSKFFVKSLGRYIGKTIGLTAVYGQPIPAFLSSAY